MVIETPNWNEDKFGAKITEGIKYSAEKRGNTHELTPIVGESLAGYNRRILSIIQRYEEINLDAHTGRVPGKKMWFTHRTPSGCWLCNDINVMWMISDVLDLVSNTQDGEHLIFREVTRGQLNLLHEP